MKKSTKKWFSFDFGSENVETKEKAISPIKKQVKPVLHENTKEFVTSKRTFNFHAAVSPKNVGDLAVHSKKIKELEDWLQNNVQCGHQNEVKNSILLITGPTGCGKTTALQVLCKKLCISILEWINPVDQDSEYGFNSNQVERFKEFLTESKWNSLFDSGNNKKIILVEDFPNAVVHRPDEFFNVLEACFYKMKCSIIFICTDSLVKNGLQLSNLLFPQEIKDKYAIHNISFNSCADTLMKNALKRAQFVVQDNLDLFRIPSINTVTAIVATTMGDIRSAINQYYMASLIGSKELPTESTKNEKTGTKRKRNNCISKVVSMNRDETLGLFHGLGRVLNPKRKQVGDSWRLNCDIEKLVDEFSTQPMSFIAFLFENYHKYFGDLNEVYMASDVLSISCLFLDKWGDRNNDTAMFALWLAVLGLMTANEHRVSKWTQIRGPRKIKSVINNELKLQNLSVTDYHYYNIIKGTNTSHTFNFKNC